MRKRAAGIGIRMPTATHGEKSGAWLDGGGVGSEHQLRVLYTIQLVARQSAASEPPTASPWRVVRQGTEPATNTAPRCP